MRANEEAKLHIAVVQYLNYSCPKLMFFHCPNGGSRDIREAAMLKKMGVKSGVADLLLFWRGGMGALELKSLKGSMSDNQKKFRTAWIQRGGNYSLCRSMNDVEQAVIGWGLEPKFRIPSSTERSGRQMLQMAVFDALHRPEGAIPSGAIYPPKK